MTWLISVSAREAMATSRNRMALTAGMWRAQACIAYARGTLRDAPWDHVDRSLVDARSSVSACVLTARAVGSRLNVNAADEVTLSRLFRAAGWRAARADSAAAAITNWIATNGPFVNVGELHRVHGIETFARLDSLLDVEPGPLALSQAPRELLALLPGFTDRTIQAVLDARARGASVTTFQELAALLDPEVPDASAKLPGLILLTPEAWILTARTRTGTPPVTTVMEVRLTRGGSGLATRRRSWVE